MRTFRRGGYRRRKQQTKWIYPVATSGVGPTFVSTQATTIELFGFTAGPGSDPVALTEATIVRVVGDILFYPQLGANGAHWELDVGLFIGLGSSASGLGSQVQLDPHFTYTGGRTDGDSNRWLYTQHLMYQQSQADTAGSDFGNLGIHFDVKVKRRVKESESLNFAWAWAQKTGANLAVPFISIFPRILLRRLQ